MMSPQAFEQLARLRQDQLRQEASAERLAAEARPRSPRLRHLLAGSLYQLAAWLSAGVAEARSSRAGIRAIATCNGVEYWRPTATLPR